MRDKECKNLSRNMIKHCKKYSHKYMINPRGCKYYAQWCSKMMICPIRITQTKLLEKINIVNNTQQLTKERYQ